MNNLGNRPMNILEKVTLNKDRWTSNLAKAFVVTAGTLVALTATVAICLIGSSAHRPQTPGSNGSAGVRAFPPTKVTTPAENGDGSVMPLPGANQVDNGTIAAEHSVIGETPTPAPDSIPTSVLKPTLTPATVPQTESKAVPSDSEFLRGEGTEFGLPGEKSMDRAESKSVERQPPKSVRRHLERERRGAERKRSRLENMYQKHLISSEAYKKGEQEYKSEIEKYRSEVNAGRSLPNPPE